MEKIEEKWVVQEVTVKDIHVYQLQPDGNYVRGKGLNWCLDELIENPRRDSLKGAITAIKSPTGEIFRVGDYVLVHEDSYPKGYPDYKSTGCIKSFDQFSDSRGTFPRTKLDTSEGEGWVMFDDRKLTKKEKPETFLTEDGVEVGIGTTIWCVQNSTKKVGKDVVTDYKISLKREGFHHHKFFSSKEKAEEYVESLKPKVLFVTADGIEITDDKTLVYGVEASSVVLIHPFGVTMGIWKKENVFFYEEKAKEHVACTKAVFSIKDIEDIYKGRYTNAFLLVEELKRVAKTKV